MAVTEDLVEGPSSNGQIPGTGSEAQTDGSASFLRAARAGNLEKVLEYLKGSIDINTSNANGLNALHLAAKEGHVNVVNELLKRGANVNAATKKGNTALHIASLAGQEEVVKILVGKQANVNVQSQNGFTPLYMAAQENHDGVVRFLLANGANQSLATEDGFTPLAVALQQGHDRVVAVLLENDAKGKVRLPALHIAAKKDDCKAAALLLHSEHNPDVTSKSGFTPLHIAAHYGNSNIAALLLEKGADVNFPAKHQITPLHVAAKWGKINMVKLLLEKGAKLDASTRDGLTPLHCAARSGHDQVVELLLERNAPITAKTKNGLAPLHMASQGDHVDSARILLYHKAPVDDVTVDYLTALHVAAHCGHVGVAKLLLDRRAEPNARALNGFTPLHIACKKNRIKVVELLLKHGASIEATTESGLTPLHVASFMGCMNIVIYLLQHGANPDIPTVRGETPLHLAARANQTDIIRILLRNGAHVDAKARELQTALHIGARLGNADMVGLLLQHGAAVDAPTKDQYTPLHVAAREGQDEVAALLLDHGASLAASTKKGFTPLHLAAKHGNIKVARLLLQKDAPVDAQGKNGVTPLHVAAHYDHVNVALLLLEKGASPHAAARNGYTPLHVAARKDQMDIATTLLEHGAKPNAESRAGFTPLHLAAQEGHADVATLLVEHGAQCDAKAKNGLTPLHLCAQEDRVNVAAILAKNGATVDPTTKAGYTPLHVACHFGQINMIRFLLQHGSNVNATTAHGYTPLHQAAQQGHTLIINLLLEHRASPNATTNQGQTALSIAQRLGYISVVETLKVVTETIVTTTTTTVTEEKYKVVAPETMHETFMSDSEDEGAEDNMLGDQSFRYLTADEMKSLGDDSLPIDVTRDERLIESVNVTREAGHIAPLTQEEERLSPTHAHQTEAVFVGNYAPDNIDISRTPIHAGFLVSFLVDARGGAMRGCRHSGVRVIIPPRKAPGPMRITCRYLRKEKLQHPPPLLEGEACASRILEVGPAGAKFLGPVIIEVPHFASLRGKEREITILRSDNGETWKEHTLEASEEAVQEVLNESFEGEELTALEDLHTNRITRILTTDFPQYFAVVTRSRQEVHAIGPEGGLVSSTVVPQVQAIFPEGALTKKIRVGLQAQPIHSDLVTKLLGNRVAVSPIVTVEPRRRKFHKPITLTIPVPQAATKGMINQYSGDAPTLRLLCSITGGVNKALWEDVTGSTPLTFVNDCVSFTTTVSARFWLMDCRQVNEATRFATELYAEAIHVPFMAKFVVFAKRHDPQEAQLRVFCMTDDKEDKTLETQEHFTEVAKSRDVEVLENKPQYLEFAGNLIPVTKSGEQLSLTFQAFRENRIPFNVRVKDLHQETLGRVAFMKEPRGSRTDPPQTPICNLNIALPEFETSRAASELVTLEKKYGFVEETGLAKPELIHRADLRLSDIARELGKDWEPLGQQLDIPEADMHSIRTEFPGDLAQQALLMLRLWMQRAGPKATGNNLEKGLRRINREDIVNKCMFNVELVTDDVEKAVAKVHLDQSGFDTFREELGTSRNASLRRDGSLDASYDEPDIMKEAESAEETSSETGSVHEKHGASEAKVRKPKKADTESGPKTVSPEATVHQVTVPKRGSKEGTPTIALEESFDDVKVENRVEPSGETAKVVTGEIEKPKKPSPSGVPEQHDLITQEQLDELVEGVLCPEMQQKTSEKKQIGPVIVEERELSDSPDSIVKVVSIIKRTVTQLPVTEVGVTESKRVPVLGGKGEDDSEAASIITTKVDMKSGPLLEAEVPSVSAGIVTFPPDIREGTQRDMPPIPVEGDASLTGKGDLPPYTVSYAMEQPGEGPATTVVRTVTTEVKGLPLDEGTAETIITTQTTTTTSAPAPVKQTELSANLLDEMFGDTSKGKGGQYGHILEPEEVAKLKAQPGMKKEDLELLEQLFPDQPASKAYPPEGLVPENVIIPEYRTFVTAEQSKKPMSPKKKERVLEKIGRALSQEEMEAPSKPRLLRAATVDSTLSAPVTEEPDKEEVKEPVIEMQRVEESKAVPSTLPSEVPEVASAADEPLAQTMEFRTKPSDDAIVTKTTTQFQDVLDDGTVKHTVTTITRTTIIQEVEEGAPQADAPSAPPAADVLQPGAKPGESETWASDLDTSQVSVSSLPEDEKTEPTATLSSATTTAEPEGTSTSEPGVQTQVEEKEPSYEDLVKREEHKEHGTTAGIVLLGDGDHEEVDQGIRFDTTCPVGDLLDLNGTQFCDGEAAGGFKYDTSVDQSSGVTPSMLTEVQSGLFRLPDITSTCADSSPIGGKDTITHLISSEIGPAITSALSNGEGQEVASDFNLPGARSPTAIIKDDITREDSYGDTGRSAADSVEENSEDETSIATVYQRISATSEMLPSRGQASMQDVLSGAGTNLIGIVGSVTGTGDAESERRKCDDSLVSVDGGELPGFEEKSHSSDTIHTVPKDTQSGSAADASQGLEGVEGSGCDAFCILSTENVSMFNSSEMPGKSSALDTTPVLSPTTQESCRTVPEPSAAGVNSLGHLLLPEQQSMTVVGLGHEDLGAFEDIKLVDMPIGQEGSLIISDISILPAVQDVPGITPGDSILESDVFTDLLAMASQSGLQAVPRDVGCKDENGARHSIGDKEVHKGIAEKSRDSVEPVSEEGKATMCTPISSPQTLCAIAGSVLERSQPGLSSVREVPRQEVLPGIGHEEEGDLGMLVQSAASSVSSTLPLCEISGIEDWPGPSGIVRSSTVASAPTAAVDATIPEGRGPAEVVPAEPETSTKFEVLDKLQKTPSASRKQITVPKEALDLHKMLHSAESLDSCPAVEVTSVVCSADDVLMPRVEKSQEEELQETASQEKSKKKKKKHGKKR